MSKLGEPYSIPLELATPYDKILRRLNETIQNPPQDEKSLRRTARKVVNLKSITHGLINELMLRCNEILDADPDLRRLLELHAAIPKRELTPDEEMEANLIGLDLKDTPAKAEAFHEIRRLSELIGRNGFILKRAEQLNSVLRLTSLRLGVSLEEDPRRRMEALKRQYRDCVKKWQAAGHMTNESAAKFLSISVTAFKSLKSVKTEWRGSETTFRKTLTKIGCLKAT